MNFYLDESGDTGFKFDLPFGQAGSSRYLSICVVETPPNLAVYVSAIINKLQQKYKWTGKEKKAKDLSEIQKAEFVSLVLDLLERQPAIKIHAITVYKPNVQAHIQADCNKLYNYMVILLLLDRMALYPKVKLAHDQRSVKVASGNSLNDYLQSELWFKKNAVTVLETESLESHNNRNIIFVDFVANICWTHYEKNSAVFNDLKPKIHNLKLFFPK
jgi:hypothetical protein